MSTAFYYSEKQVFRDVDFLLAGGFPVALDDGGWAIFGHHAPFQTDEENQGLYWARFDAEGRLIDKLHKTEFPETWFSKATVITTVEEGWLLTFREYHTPNFQTSYQLIGHNGELIGDRVTVTDLPDEHFPLETTILSDGGKVMLGITGIPFGLDRQRYFQRLDVEGNKVGGLNLFSTDLNLFIDEQSDGSIDVLYVSRSDGSDPPVLMVSHFAEDGSQLGAVETVGPVPIADLVRGEIFAFDDGTYLITGVSTDDFNGYVVQMRMTADGALIGEVQTVQQSPDPLFIIDRETVILPDGGWLTVWSERNSNEGFGNLYMRRYDRDGNAVTDAERVSEANLGNKANAEIIVLDDGGWLISWNYTRTDQNMDGVFFQRYSADGARIENNNAPEGTDFQLDVGRGTSYQFDNSDFSYNDFEVDELKSITIADLSPDSRLFFMGQRVSAGQTIEAGDLDHLEWRAGVRDRGGTEWFDYIITDDGGSSLTDTNTDLEANRVSINVLSSVIGTAKNNNLKDNNHGQTFMTGLAGNDVISGGAGNDYLFGGTGRDNLAGGSGQDVLVGGKGDDVLLGGEGADVFRFQEGMGHDTIKNFQRSDTIDLRDFHEFVNFASLESRLNYGFREVKIKLNSDDWLFVEGRVIGHLGENDFLFYTE